MSNLDHNDLKKVCRVMSPKKAKVTAYSPLKRYDTAERKMSLNTPSPMHLNEFSSFHFQHPEDLVSFHPGEEEKVTHEP